MARSWADITEDSDQEDSREGGLSGFGLATVPEDCSYQGPTVSSCEDSKDGMNAAFNSAAAVSGKGSRISPADFSFLMAESAAEQDETMGPDDPLGSNNDEDSASLSSCVKDFNPGAPDFIPTCNPEMVALAVVTNIQNAPQATLPENLGPKTPKRGHLTNTGSVGEGSSEKGQVSRKRTRARVEKPQPLKRCRGRRHSAEKNDDQKSETTSANSGLSVGEMPEATEEEWQHRAEMRSKHIEHGKAMLKYKLYLELVPKNTRDSEEPMTPDHEDRTLSKRKWKNSVEVWRQNINERVGKLGQDSSTTEKGGIIPEPSSLELWQAALP